MYMTIYMYMYTVQTHTHTQYNLCKWSTENFNYVSIILKPSQPVNPETVIMGERSVGVACSHTREGGRLVRSVLYTTGRVFKRP